MEEDIDIEEHDVLDNPRIRNIFGADLTQIKAEIPEDDYYDNDNQIVYQPYSEEQDSLQGRADDASEDTARLGNKIILGSKPSSTSRLQVTEDIQNGESVLVFGRKVQIKQEVSIEYGEDHNFHGEPEEEYNQGTNVLIIGSKPSTSGLIEPLSTKDVITREALIDTRTMFSDNIFEINDNSNNTNKDPTKAYVAVENWGPHLENSLCYCKDCKILFPTPNTLSAHNMTAHSFLVVLDKNKAVKSTAKPSAVSEKSGTGKFCNHCNKMFPDSDSLINHLYEKLTFDKKALTGFNYQPKKVVARPTDSQSKIILGKVPNVIKEPDVNTLDAKAQFRCEVCTCYFNLYINFFKHMRKQHLRNDFSKKKEIFDGSCVRCDSKLSNKVIYRKHIKNQHPELYFFKDDRSSTEAKTPKVLSVKIKTEKINMERPGRYKCTVCQTIFPTYAVGKYHRKIKHPEFRNQFILRKIVTTYNRNTIANRRLQQRAVSSKFQCSECGEIFAKYALARQHRRLKHPELKTQRIIQHYCSKPVPVRVLTKIAMKTNEKSPKASPTKAPEKRDSITDVKPSMDHIVVPKSFVFKCNKCEVHFSSCTAAVLHSKSCKKQKGDWRCTICDRYFMMFDKIVHRMQHDVSKELSVIVCFENIYGRVLNQCPSCKLYFHEKKFYFHEQKDSCSGSSVKCEECSMPIHISSVAEHTKWHKRIYTTKKNMILVEYSKVAIASGSSVAAKRKLFIDQPEMNVKKVKIEKQKPKLTVRYCIFCRCYLFSSSHNTQHINGLCKSDPRVKKANCSLKFCKYCGLSYISRSHILFHRANPNITLMDMKFYTLQDNKLIAPAISDFPKCTKCQVHFCTKTAVDTHNCKDSFKVCKHCQKKYSDLAHKLHMRLHEYNTKFNSMTIKPVAVPKKIKVIGSPQIQDPLPELLKKYEMLTNTWNILFLCKICDIVCDNYDKTVEHCQNHFNNMESLDMYIETCKICDLMFDSTCFEKHKDLHAENKSITKESFMILTYEYTNLLKSTWLDQFKTLPKTQLEQIVSRSIYKHGRSVKLRVVQEGPPETTVYKCGKCDKYIHPNTLTNHYKNVLCDNEMIDHKCRYCVLRFCSLSAREYHEKDHPNAKVFKIVYFNEKGDEEFNDNLRQNEAIQSNSSEYTKAKTKVTSYHYYKCANCQCCFSERKGLRAHKCPTEKMKEYCKICNMYIHRIMTTRHKKMHLFKPKLMRKNIKITVFKPYSKQHPDRSTLNNLYKCKCGLHFTSTTAIEAHLKICGTDVYIAKEKCSKCKRLFDTTQLVTHLCKHHSKDDPNTRLAIYRVSNDKPIDLNSLSFEAVGTNSAITVKDDGKTLYKCQKCDVYYLSQGGLDYHYSCKHEISKVIPCPHCKLRFMPKTMIRHIALHHKKMKCKAGDFTIRIGDLNKSDSQKILTENIPKPQQKKQNIKDAIQKYNKNLYKCDSCPAHFLAWWALRSHLSRGTHNVKVSDCATCGYSFTQISLLNHIKVHHKIMNLKREDFSVKNFQDKDTCDSEVDNEEYDQRPADNNSLHSKYDAVDGNHTDDSADVSVNMNKIRKKDADEKETKREKDKYLYKNIIYKCGVCKCLSINHCESHMIQHHTTDKKEYLKHEDCFCGLRFCAHSIKKHHLVHHVKQNITPDDLYVVTMNLYEGNYVESNHLFRCGVCKINYFNRSSLESHMSQVEHITVNTKCSECGLLFSISGYNRHITLHHDVMKLDLKDFIVLESEGNSLRVLKNLEEQTGTVEMKVQTQNDATITEQEDVDNETNLGNDNSNVLEKENAEFSDLEDETSGSKINASGKLKIYQCEKCKCCFFKYTSVMSHYYKCETSPASTKCDQCSLHFYKPSLIRHKANHHKNKNLKLEDMIIKTYKPTSRAAKKAIEISEKISTLDTNLYTNKLFKCSTCCIHFMVEESLDKHVQNPNILMKSTCTICGLAFAINTLPTHVYIQHEKMNLTHLDFAITSKEEVIEKDSEEEIDEVGTSGEIHEDSASVVLDKAETSSNETNLPEQESDIEFVVASADSLEIDEPPCHEDPIYFEEKTDGPSTSPSSSNVNKDDSDTIKLYKCSDCNVCFLSQTACYKHVTKHTPLHPKDYIECKLCGYQFLILNNCLHKHITKHHKGIFKPEKVLIEEYHPNVRCLGTPKIDLYFANDKVQSKLISTTSEGNVSSDFSEDVDIDLTV